MLENTCMSLRGTNKRNRKRKNVLTRLCNLLIILDLSYNSSLMKKRHVYEINRL